jgi:2-(1,2-epoxy-1,2-dihydrophenyl)acetyl-CoA isomerase
VVAADNAEFVAAYGAIGLSPDCGVSALLPALVGPRRAAVLMLTNRRLTADDAFAWGLVSEICPAGDVAGRSNALAREVADRPGRAAGETARLLRAANDRGYAAQLTAELATISRLSTSPAAGALIAQFAATGPAPEATA